MNKNDVELKILKEINEIRINPLKYSEKIEYYLNFINGNYIYIPNKDFELKIKLNKGKNSFLECIESLRNLSENMQKNNYRLEELVSIEELKFIFPKNSLDKVDNSLFIDEYFEEIKKNINGKYELRAFNYRISCLEIEPFSIMHLIDDDNFNKIIQRVLLSENTKYVGISFNLIEEGVYIIYFIYAN